MKHWREAWRVEFARRIRVRREECARTMIEPPPPRYDEVFWAGVEWLDSLAGEWPWGNAVAPHARSDHVATNTLSRPDPATNPAALMLPSNTVSTSRRSASSRARPATS